MGRRGYSTLGNVEENRARTLKDSHPSRLTISLPDQSRTPVETLNLLEGVIDGTSLEEASTSSASTTDSVHQHSRHADGLNRSAHFRLAAIFGMEELF